VNVRFDHVVLWVADPLRSVEFYERVLGLAGVRVEEFKAGQAPFPSVRLSADAIIDLVSLALAPMLNARPGVEGSAGNKVNHICLAMSKDEFVALRERLDTQGIAVPATMKDSFGARGFAPEAIYFTDPDGNVIEARYYT
jgi:catechol 2,3-dioxygenase-like lactoylglutathione lyase family enzyme